MSNIKQSIEKNEIMNSTEKMDEDFDASIINATNSFREKKLGKEFYAELVNLIKTKKLSCGILKFSIKTCDPYLWNGQHFLVYTREKIPDFISTCMHVNKEDKSREMQFEFFQR